MVIMLALLIAGLFKPEFVAGMFLRTRGRKTPSAAYRRALDEPHMWSTRVALAGGILILIVGLWTLST
jgi:cytochrome c biogenesis protein CcdA